MIISDLSLRYVMYCMTLVLHTLKNMTLWFKVMIPYGYRVPNMPTLLFHSSSLFIFDS